MREVDDIHEERLRNTEDQDVGDKKSEQAASCFSKEVVQDDKQEPRRSKVDERSKARFSTSFDDKTLKSSLINTHSQYRKRQPREETVQH